MIHPSFNVSFPIYTCSTSGFATEQVYVDNSLRLGIMIKASHNIISPTRVDHLLPLSLTYDSVNCRSMNINNRCFLEVN